jgi:glutathione reductase (NADPH)
VRVSADAGIDIKLQCEVTKLEQQGESFMLSVAGSKDEELKTDLVVSAIGRVPEIDDLNLIKGNVEHGKKGIAVNEYLQSTSNPRVYAAGDVAASPGLPLTPVAVYEGHTIASNVIKGNTKKINYPEIPTVVFTIPALASVGLTEEQANQKKLVFEVNSHDARQWYNGKRTLANAYFYKVLVSKTDGSILGAHLVGPRAEETINIFALAMKAGLKAKDLRSFMFSYPTMASDISYMV